MKILENLTGTEGETFTNKDIAQDFTKDLENSIISLSIAACETTNPQLRQILDAQLISAINKHHELSDMMIKKSWYNAYDEPIEQVKNSLMESKRLLQFQSK